MLTSFHHRYFSFRTFERSAASIFFCPHPLPSPQFCPHTAPLHQKSSHVANAYFRALAWQAQQRNSAGDHERPRNCWAGAYRVGHSSRTDFVRVILWFPSFECRIFFRSCNPWAVGWSPEGKFLGFCIGKIGQNPKIGQIWRPVAPQPYVVEKNWPISETPCPLDYNVE